MLVVIIILFVAFLLLFYASYSISAGVYMKSLCRNKAAKDLIAITFDDGVDPILTPKVLDVLKRYDAKATFFIIGKQALHHAEILKRIVAEGHSIGNHSYSHIWDLPFKSSQSIYNDISMCTAVLKQSADIDVTLFRPPFGVTNPMIAKAVKKSGLISIGWSIRSFDTMGQDLDIVKHRVTKQIDGGKVILLHDNRENADLLLESILVEIKKRGLRAVTINKLFNL
ncbi:MAG: polysaccharide deacetylase family protein [Rikenellaceae bacterium]